jgi:hypothetical protein
MLLKNSLPVSKKAILADRSKTIYRYFSTLPNAARQKNGRFHRSEEFFNSIQDIRNRAGEQGSTEARKHGSTAGVFPHVEARGANSDGKLG